MSIPADHLDRTPIFHITAVENLRQILEHGGIFSTNHRPCECLSIANEDIQTKRATQVIELPPNGVLHDYVPFYFAPRSPMLYVNHRQGIANARQQSEIIYLVSSAQIIAAAHLPFVFYDRHPVKPYAAPFNDLADLKEIDWRIFFEDPRQGGYSTYWQDRDDPDHPHWISRKEIRQAEFLVHRKVDWQFVKGIATYDETKAEQVRVILHEFGLTTPVKAKRNWYY